MRLKPRQEGGPGNHLFTSRSETARAGSGASWLRIKGRQDWFGGAWAVACRREAGIISNQGI